MITPRRTILDPKKLRVLNAKHLQQAIQDQDSLENLADVAKALVSEKYKEEGQRKVITGALGNDYTLKLKVSSIDPCWFLTARMQQQFTYSHSFI